MATGTPTGASTPPIAPYRSTLASSARDGFAQSVRAEWTKLRTVARWKLTLAAAGALTVLISYLAASGSAMGVKEGGPPTPVGADGLAVEDDFQFTHRTLQGDGSIVARVSGLRTAPSSKAIPEWAKAGVLVKQSTEPGSPYAAVMMTKDHGVRMQSGFTDDTAGSDTPRTTARWLKLTRSGDELTGYESADGDRWSAIGTVRLDGLPRNVEAGLFAASPPASEVERTFGSLAVRARPTWATAVFDDVTLSGTSVGPDTSTGPDGSGGPGTPDASGGGAWRDTRVGAGSRPFGGGPPADPSGTTRSAGAFTVTGSGDIGPSRSSDSDVIAQSLTGGQLGMVLLAGLGALFITAEYRRGMIRTTLTATSRRGRMLLAKAVVLGGATFAVSLVATVLSFSLGMPVLRDNGFKPPFSPEMALTDGPVLRTLIGTAAVLALIAVLALGIGALLRHTAAAIGVVIVLTVLPSILTGMLPLSLAKWVQGLTPAAGFALQDNRTRYEHVTNLCLPDNGCYEMGSWAGFATLCAYVVVALGLALWRLRRSDV
ncbi:ABC transporter permease subunit [Streptomyces sp. NPDC004726]